MERDQASKFINDLLRLLVWRGGSDLFLTCDFPPAVKVDGKVVATKTMPKTLPMILQWDEAFDIGSDTLTGVNDADYQPPFALTAKLNKLTIKVDRPQLSPDDIKKLEAAMKGKD